MIMSARGDGSEMARNERNVCIALATGFEVRIGLGLTSGRHLRIFRIRLQRHDENDCATRKRSPATECGAAGAEECRVWDMVTKGFQGLGNTFVRKRTQKYAEPNAVVSETDRAGIELTLALKDAATARGAEFCAVFIPFKKRMEKRLPDNHPLVPVLAAGLTQMDVNYREPYPEFLKSAAAGTELFHPPDNHFNAAGHALFAKFVTDTDLAQASTNYYADP